MAPEINRSYECVFVTLDPKSGSPVSSHVIATMDSKGFLYYKFKGHIPGMCGGILFLMNLEKPTVIGMHIEGDQNSPQCKAAAITKDFIKLVEDSDSPLKQHMTKLRLGNSYGAGRL
jgi:hypothetical protein